MTPTSNDHQSIPDGIKIIEGTKFIGDGKGGWQPVALVKPQHLLEDQTVRNIIGYADPLSKQISRFKQHTFDDIGAFEAILADEYDAKIGGKKGNKTLLTVDGLFKVQVAVADNIAFGPELQTAKLLFDECLNDWSSTSNVQIQAIVTRAFNTDKEGKISPTEIYSLLRLNIDDERWQRAMTAIKDAMRTVGSKTYIRCYRRASHEAEWQAITIDLAKA
ncbi:DUF3164 family protein [Pacificibacter sp. AS14]|uniref:DUF3164 family protein n=1 Tax=Pacificibacter sp. AS14 TaxID=3135785 RepID=UPI00317F3103